MSPAHKLAGKKLMIGVMTCPKFAHRANGVRATWLKDLPAGVRVLFVLGRPGEAPRVEGDSLFVDCNEAYENLPEKVFRFYEFCHGNIEFDYILKVDDDSYVQMERLLKFDTQAADYIGLFQDFGDPDVTRTWHYGKCDDKSLEVPYQGEYVCDWARGGGYLLSKKAVSILLEKLPNTYQDHLFEDKMVGEALAPDDRIETLRAHYVEMGILNPMPPRNMKFVHRQLTRQAPAKPAPKAPDPKERGIDFGDFRRLRPISQRWGFDRGRPIDRYYIESFMAEKANRVQGRVLEIKDDDYTRMFGADRVTKSEILDIDAGNERATLVADISDREKLEENQFDCVIFTQTLQLIPDPQAAIRNLHYILKPGGTLLLTCPGISKVQTRGLENCWYYFFTPLSLDALFRQVFEPEQVEIIAHGNVLTATSFLWGLAADELRPAHLEFRDPDFPLLLTACAQK